MSPILPKKNGLFRYSVWDAIPVVSAFVHLAYLFSMYAVFTYLQLPIKFKFPLLILMGVVYSFSICWNLNGISHNFIHNKYFNSGILNRIFSIVESVCCLFSQVLYDYIHRRHHMGNSDKPGENGDTIDWVSIYRHGHDGHAENAWKFMFISFFREDPKAAYREIKKHDAAEARWGIVEIVIVGCCMVGTAILNWRFMAYFVPFWYFGHCLSYLNGYFEHFGANPDVPMAWGVSSYHKFYNLIWFNNGYHAEHHYRPRAHWTRMQMVKDHIVEDQKRVGVRVIKPPHVFGFCDSDVCDEPLVPLQLAPLEKQDHHNAQATELVDLANGS